MAGCETDAERAARAFRLLEPAQWAVVSLLPTHAPVSGW